MVEGEAKPGLSSSRFATGGANSPASQSTAEAERMVREHGDALWRFVMSRTRSVELSEDIVQETFLAAIQGGATFSGLSSERTWLLAIAAHKVADQFRNLRKRAGRERAAADVTPKAIEEGSEFTAGGKWAKPPVEWTNMAENEGETREMLMAMRACLDDLPPSMAEVIWLRDLLNIPSEEVCKSLGITPTNMWSRTHRARALLRRCVERVLGFEREGED